MKNIILEYEKHEPRITGNKAANLARLKSAGFLVPSFVTILPCAFSSDQDPTLVNELKEAREIFSVGDYLLAVRSSAIDEDGEITSFAGQLDSFLNVKSDMVITAAKSVWLSGSSERLKSYCQKLQIDKQANGPAVIVQKMVDAKIAGVAFSADPVSGARDTVVISAVNGLADRLVSGEVPGDLLYVLNGREIKRAACVGEKSVINDELAIEIAHAARKIETLFSCPQDIEWAHDGKQLFILQARPITNLPDPQKCQDGNLRIWDNSNISESYQGVTTPLTFSFASKAYKHVYIHFCRLMGVSDKRIRDNQQIFPSMLGFIRGRIYYNLVNWYRLLALLPGFQVNRPFMEQMMGVKEELPPEVIEQVLKDNKTTRLTAYKDFGVSLLAMLVRFANLKREIETFQNHFETTLDEVPKDLSSLNTDQLAKLYRSLEDRLLSSWDAPLVNDFFAMVFFGLLNSLSIKWIKSKTFSHHELLVQSGGIISAQPVEMIEAMATIAQSDPQLQSSLRTGSLAQIEKAVKENLKFETALKNYLERFGDRCFNELKLESPTLKDDPLPLLRNIGHMEFLPERKSFRNRKENREAREAISELPLAQRLIFNFVAAQAVERIRWRENLRFERTRLFGLVRRIFLQFAQSFVALGVLKNTNDIFYLEVEEILSFVEGKNTTQNIGALAELRKKEFLTFRNETPPLNRIVTRQTIVESNMAPLAGNIPSTKELTGLGCSPGIVRGRVRVVHDPSTAKPLDDEILIAERTDPGWIVLFTQAKGIIVEYGSLLSHTAIVSRELGIPAIVSASGVMNWLSDGDIVELDGKTGSITKLSDFTSTGNAQLQSTESVAQNSEHDLSDNVVKLIDSTGLAREAS